MCPETTTQTSQTTTQVEVANVGVTPNENPCLSAIRLKKTLRDRLGVEIFDIVNVTAGEGDDALTCPGVVMDGLKGCQEPGEVILSANLVAHFGGLPLEVAIAVPDEKVAMNRYRVMRTTWEEDSVDVEDLVEGSPLSSAQTDDLYYEENGVRIWVSRMGLEDGAEADNMVTVEARRAGNWVTVDEFPLEERGSIDAQAYRSQ